MLTNKRYLKDIHPPTCDAGEDDISKEHKKKVFLIK